MRHPPACTADQAALHCCCFRPSLSPLLDPPNACRRGSASQCSAGAAQEHLSQPSAVGVEAGAQGRARRECGDVVQMEKPLGEVKSIPGLAFRALTVKDVQLAL